jgi:sugar O-acyltransferase (sialic acid O-acetyltransferase NeuD family)
MIKLAIFGTSGFAHEVADIGFALGVKEILLLTHDDDIVSSTGIQVLPENEVANLQKKGFKFALGFGEPNTKKRVSSKYSTLDFPNLIHPSAIFGNGQRQKINQSRGNIVTAGVIFTNNIKIGDFGVFNLNCTIGHDCIIEDYVSIMPSVNVSGNVHLKECSYIGVGATILQGLNQQKLCIGTNSIVGAAALVTKNVGDNLTVIGAPAKPLGNKIAK